MTDILVFSPASSRLVPESLVSPELGEICGFLKSEGYQFDQKSLFVEHRYLNQYRINDKVIDPSVFDKEENMLNYLKGGQDPDIEEEAQNMAERLDLESYEVIVVAVSCGPVASVGYVPLATPLPILKEAAKDKTVIIAGNCRLEEMEVAKLDFIDYAVDGDIEIPLKNILRHEFGDESLQIEPGVMCERNGELKRGSFYRHPINERAKPYYESEILKRHAETSLLQKKVVRYNLGRGSTEGDSYSAYVDNQNFEYKNIDKVVSELSDLKDETGAEHVRFKDFNVLNDPKYIRRLSMRLKEEQLNISWSSRADIVGLDQDFFEILRAGGCSALHFAIQTVSDSMIERMQKNQTKGMIEETLKNTSNAGIKPFAYFRVGHPLETWDEYFETLEFIRQTDYLMGAAVRPFDILPSDAQDVYKNPESYGIKIEDRKGNHYLDNIFDCSLKFRFKNRNLSWEEWRENRNLKVKHMQRAADMELFLKNYGRKYPVETLRKIARKIYTRDYLDGTYPFA